MGLSLHLERWGEGSRPVLLLHGFTGSSASWDHLKPTLQEHVRAIAVDLPGHGQSDLPSATGREGFEETLDALEALLREEAEIDVIGYSQGARIALGLAMRLRIGRGASRIKHLILESGTAGLKRGQERAARRAEDETTAMFLEAHGVAEFVKKWEALPLFAGIRRLPSDAQAQLRARRQASSVQGLAGALRCLGLGAQPSYWPELSSLRVPTLLLTGADDLKFTKIAHQMSVELAMGWRHAFPDCGHAPHLEKPNQYIDELLSFLNAPEITARAQFAT